MRLVLATGSAAAINIAVTVTVLLAVYGYLGFKKINIHAVLNFTYPHWS
jgi:hypothetical protein